MQRLLSSAVYGFLLTLYGGSIYYFLGYLYTVSQGGNVVKFASDTLAGCLIAFLAFTFFLYDLSGRLNEPRKKDDDTKGGDSTNRPGPQA